MKYPVLLCILLFLSSCGDAGSNEPTLGSASNEGAAPTAIAPAAKREFKVGDPINFDAFELTVKSVQERSSVGVLDTKPADGGLFIAVTYTIKNTGQKPLGMFDRPTLKLLDQSGTAYAPDLNASAQFSIAQNFNAKGASNLNPGITTTDGQVWEIAEKQFDRAQWKLVLDGHEDFPIALE